MLPNSLHHKHVVVVGLHTTGDVRKQSSSIMGADMKQWQMKLSLLLCSSMITAVAAQT